MTNHESRQRYPVIPPNARVPLGVNKPADITEECKKIIKKHQQNIALLDLVFGIVVKDDENTGKYRAYNERLKAMMANLNDDFLVAKGALLSISGAKNLIAIEDTEEEVGTICSVIEGTIIKGKYESLKPVANIAFGFNPRSQVPHTSLSIVLSSATISNEEFPVSGYEVRKDSQIYIPMQGIPLAAILSPHTPKN